MSENAPIINNYSIDVRQLLNEVAIAEQQRAVNLLVEAGVLKPADDGNGYLAVVYKNFEDRTAEGHEPDLTLINIGRVEPQPEADKEPEAAE